MDEPTARRITMRQTLIVLTAALALALPATALADDSTDPNASQGCKAQRTQMGDGAFKATYGTNANKSNAFGKCVSKMSSAQKSDVTGSNSKCKTEQDDPNFAATHGGKTFAQFYGTNKNGKNAFGKCVSAKTETATDDRNDAIVSAAKTCKTERKADPAAFKNKYGTNKNKANAFGKCVSSQAKAKQQS
jgi:hypothetical protein